MWLFGAICGFIGGGALVWVGKDWMQSFWTTNEAAVASLEAKLAALKAKL